MGSSIFADESGDESARERRTDDRRRSVFRRHDDDRRSTDGDGTGQTGEEPAGDDEGESADDRATGGGEGETMRVFNGSEVFEVSVDDE
jgi:hypothetical protein